MVKQSIIVKTKYNINGKSVGLRKGKIASQVAHASGKIIIDDLENHPFKWIAKLLLFIVLNQWVGFDPISLWLRNSFTKIVLKAECEEDLLFTQKAAEDNGILTALIVDNGKTEFGGKKTITALAVGPDEEDKINLITKKFSLL